MGSVGSEVIVELRVNEGSDLSLELLLDSGCDGLLEERNEDGSNFSN